MSYLTEKIPENTGEFENLALLGHSAPTILKRLDQTCMIRSLWMWCETPVGTMAQPGLESVTAEFYVSWKRR